MAGDDLNTAVEGALLIIQTHENFPIASGTDGKTLGVYRLPGQSFQRIGIKGVEGLPLGFIGLRGASGGMGVAARATGWPFRLVVRGKFPELSSRTAGPVDK